VIRGKEDKVKLIVTALLAGGNILIEDVPGVGKTTMAKALAMSIGGVFSRIQFTPDLLPADILGGSVYNPKEGSFVFRKGPIFSNIILADEINRASPRTQSSLLEAMNEKQVSLDSKTYKLDPPFLVVATQNPVEYHGTYPLPEAQLDRFAVRIEMGYPDTQYEAAIILEREKEDPLLDLRQVISCADIVKIQNEVKKVKVEESIVQYIIRIANSTRTDAHIKLGISTRGALMLFMCARAKAYIEGRDYVIPEDVKEMAMPVLPHRLVLNTKSRYSGVKKENVISEILSNTEIPV
ncbi:MAG: MoxR family ATPase, partial [Candidatus Aureabacteria bacterium]|nr:MoxR family ATPase [Candidatus Auribacterota bacterium]